MRDNVRLRDRLSVADRQGSVRVRLVLECGIVGDESKLVETSLRYVISHQSNPVVIPGATKVAQVANNAEAGAELLDNALYHQLNAMD